MITTIARRGRGWRRALALAGTGLLVGSVLLVGGSVLTASANTNGDTGQLPATATHLPNGWTDGSNARPGFGLAGSERSMAWMRVTGGEYWPSGVYVQYSTVRA